MDKPNRFFTLFLSIAALGLLGLPSLCLAATYKGENAARPLKKPLTYKNAISTTTPPPAITLKEGPYFGASGGYDSYKIHERIRFAGDDIGASFNPTINATGLIGALLAGYGHYFNNALYLGGEVFGNISEAYQSNNAAIGDSTEDLGFNSKFFVTWGYGVSLLPGVKLNDGALFFARLGYHVARLRGQETLDVDDARVAISNSSSWSGGFGYGLGFEEAMVENFSLRGEYLHIDFRTFSATSGTEYSASDNQFMLSLIYHL